MSCLASSKTSTATSFKKKNSTATPAGHMAEAVFSTHSVKKNVTSNISTYILHGVLNEVYLQNFLHR
jgi:hypothetical protein